MIAAAVPWTGREMAGGVLTVLLSLLFGVVLIQVAGLSPGPLATGLLLLLNQVGLLFPLWLVRRRYGLAWDILGFRAVPPWRLFSLVGQAILMAYTLVLLWGLVLTYFGMRAQENILPAAFGESIPALLTAWVTIAVIVPIAEEAFFRGFLFAGLLPRWGLWRALWISSLIFALLHFNLTAFPAHFGLGAILAWLYHRSGSLWPAIALHVFINSLTLFVWFAELHLPETAAMLGR